MGHHAQHGQGHLSKKTRLLQAYERLVKLRQVERKTIRECAETLGVADRTIVNYLASQEYQEAVERFRTQMREAAITSVADASRKAMSTLIELMDYEKSGHVRFEAAAKVLDLLGIEPREDRDTASDDSAEYERLLAMLASRPTTVNVFRQPVEPGGFLPQALRPEPSSESDFLPGRMLRQLVDGDEKVSS